MSLRTCFALLLIALLTGACNISTERPQATPLPPALGTASASRPVVTITAPANGTEVVVGTDILIKGLASDAQGVTRVQLIANDRIVRTVSSESSSGLRSMEVTLDYRPVVTGTLNLEVVAWRGSVPGDPASVSVTVRANRSQLLSTTVARPEVPVIDPNDPTCRVLTNVALNVRVNAGTGFGSHHDAAGWQAGARHWPPCRQLLVAGEPARWHGRLGGSARSGQSRRAVH